MREIFRFKLCLMIKFAKLVLCIICIVFLNQVHADNTDRNPDGVLINYGNGITTYISDVTTFAKYHEFGENVTEYYNYWESITQNIPDAQARAAAEADASRDTNNILSAWSNRLLGSIYGGPHTPNCLVTGPAINTDRAGSYSASFFLYGSFITNWDHPMDMNSPLFTAYLTADGVDVLASHTFIANEANVKSDPAVVEFRDTSDLTQPLPKILPISLSYISLVPLKNVQIKICQFNFQGSSYMDVHQTILDFKYTN